MTEAEQMLNQLAKAEEDLTNIQTSFNEKRDLIEAEKKKVIDLAFAKYPELLETLDEINAEFKEKTNSLDITKETTDLNNTITALKDQIVKATLEVKSTIKGDKKMCVYTPKKPGETVYEANIQMLLGMAKDHPAILDSITSHKEIDTPEKAVIRKR